MRYVVYKEIPILDTEDSAFINKRRFIVHRDIFNDACKIKSVLEDTDTKLNMYGIEEYKEDEWNNNYKFVDWVGNIVNKGDTV